MYILPGFGHPGTTPTLKTPAKNPAKKPSPKQSNFDVIFHSNEEIFY